MDYFKFCLIIYVVVLVGNAINVALTKNGATCTSLQKNCERALDGVSVTSSNPYKWAFHGEANGTQLEIRFSQSYAIYTARFMQLYYESETNFKKLLLQFDGGSTKQVQLTKRQNGYDWERFTFDPAITTQTVKIIVIAAKSSRVTFNGFMEIEFYNEILTTTTEAPTTSAYPGTNLALITNGATCTSMQANCERTQDGVAVSSSNAYRWSFSSIANGTQITITLKQSYLVYSMRFMQLYFGDESNFKDLLLEFDDGSKQQVVLAMHEDGYNWETFILNPPVSTQNIKITVIATYSANTRTYNGFSEIEVYDIVVTTPFTTTATKPPPAATTTTTTASSDFDVLILGAGIAGVTAGRTLSQLGINNFIILEGTQRVGGRMKETTIGTTTVELGASWITGTTGNPNNPMYDFALKNNMNLIKNDYDDWKVIDDNGNDVTEKADAAYERLLEAYEYSLEYRKDFLDRNCHSDYSISSGLAMGGWIAKNPIDKVCELFEIDFISTMPADISSLTYFYGTNKEFPYDHEEYYVLQQNGGFSTIVRGLLHEIPGWECKVKFNTTVSEILYTNTGVLVKTNQGVYTGRFAVVTFSLGVLQNEAVSFQPPLPDWKNEVIFGFSFGTYYNIYLKFPTTGEWFVPDNTEWTVYASPRRGYYPLWQNYEKHIPGSRIMHCTVLYEEAKRIDALLDEEVMAEAVAVLRILFGPGVPDAEDIVVPRWLSDPFTYGSYADWPKGFNKKSFDDLKAPVGPLYFAGDAYHDSFGYTNGAHLSSVRETTKLANCLKYKTQCETLEI